jgi:hypothetical protein
MDKVLGPEATVEQACATADLELHVRQAFAGFFRD